MIAEPTGGVPARTIIGIDLSGPSNPAATSVAIVQEAGGVLISGNLVSQADDKQILAIVAHAQSDGPVIVGLDAPLSSGKGLRLRDINLRDHLRVVCPGLERMVMPPTAPRMVYLSLRGIRVAHLLERYGGPGVQVVETHPGAAMAFRGVPLAALRHKRNDEGAHPLRGWLAASSFGGAVASLVKSDHDIDACAAALAVWD